MNNSTKKQQKLQLPLELKKRLAKASRLAYLLHQELDTYDIANIIGDTPQAIQYHAKRADKEINSG